MGAALFVMAIFAARRLPRDVVAAAPAQAAEKAELRSAGIVLAAGAMTLLRAAVGFLAFELFFWLREDYGLFQVGLAVAAATIGSMAGNAAAPTLRRAIHEERLLTLGLGVLAIAGAAAAFTGGLGTALALALVVNFSAAVGRLAFDAIVQRDAPDANQGRAFARFETRFQLAWVLAAIIPVAYTLPGALGFAVVGLMGVFGMTTYVLGWQALKAGRPMPRFMPRLRRRGKKAQAATTSATRSRDARGSRPITPDPRERRRAQGLPPPDGR
jgi:MFS family permease